MSAALEDVLPLTGLQEAIVYRSTAPRGADDVDPYLILADLDLTTVLPQEVDVDRLREAIATVTARHAMLRTSYTRRRTGEPVARVHTAVEVQLPVVDISTLDDGLDTLRADARSAGIALTSPPPLRFTLATDSGRPRWLFVVAHHVALDGWSLHLMFSEILRAYRGDTLAPIRPISDYARWIASRGRDVGPWVDALADLEASTIMDIVEPTTPSVPLRTRLSVHVSAALRDVATQSSATLNTVIQLAWALVLADRNDSDDVVFATVVSGRDPSVPGVDEMVGMLINTVPVRVRIDPGETVGSTLTRLQREQLALLSSHHVPLADIISAVDLGGPISSLVVFESFPRGDVRPRIEDDNDFTATLLVEDEPSIGLVLERRGADPHLLEEVIAWLTLLAHSREELLGSLTVTQSATTPPPESLPSESLPYVPVAQQISDAALRRARRTALVSGNRRVGYRELDVLAARTAHVLSARGIESESVVAVALPRGIDMVVAILAVARLGAVVAPIDPTYPPARIRFMLDDAAPVLVLDEQTFDEVRADAVDSPERAPHTPHPESAAYLIYTSGSTGTPKGVVGTAAALANRIAWAAQRWDGSVVLAKSAIAFIDGTTEILGALAAGATVAIADDTSARDPMALVELVDRHAVDQVTAVPSLARALVDLALESRGTDNPVTDSPASDNTASDATVSERPALEKPASERPARPEPTASIRRWIVSGEPLPDSTAAQLASAADEVVNSYGSSEVAGDVTTATIRIDSSEVSSSPGDTAPRDVTAAVGTITVGTQVPGAGVVVLDRHLHPVSVGRPGEVYVTGVQLARGYHGHSDWTATRFVANPVGSGDRMYRTGDRGLITPDGSLQLLGRADSQVKIRGTRVELGEVEQAVLALDGVDDAVAVAGQDHDGHTRLDVYVAGAQAPDAVPAALVATLPAAMIPATWTRLDSLPRTPGGKTDRRALPAPTSPRTTSRREPSTDLERLVVDTVADVLGLDAADTARPSVDDNFFDLGGHSLSATRVLTRLRLATGRVVGVAEVFAHPRLVDLAALFADDSDAPESTPAGVTGSAATKRPQRPERIPLSPAQRRLAFQSGIGDAAYTIPFAVRFDGPIDVAQLQRALDGIVERHESLRTRIVDDAQVVDRVDDARVLIDDHHIEPADLDATIDSLIGRPFELSADLPLRADLLRASEASAVLLLTVHHIAADEWSAATLFDELAVGYNGTPVAAPQLQYADHTLAEIERLGTVDDPRSLVHRQLDYWRNQLADAPAELDLPYDRPRPTEPDPVGGQVEIVIDADVLGGLRSAVRALDATVFMAAHAAVALVLNASGAGDDIVVGTPVAGRASASVESLIGMFVNTLPLRTDLSGDPTLLEVLRRVRETDVAALAAQDVPFDEIVTALAPERALSRHPVFQTMVQYRDPIVAPEFTGVRAEPVFPHSRTAKFDLTFEFVELARSAGIRLRVEYAAALFDEATVADLAERVSSILRTLVGAPSSHVAQLRLGPSAELPALPAPDIAPPRRSLVDIFSATARTFGDRPAVSDGTRTLTYRELDAHSSSIAARLHRDGVRRGHSVALILERSTDLVAAILGVLRCGAAYVPIDPAYPGERKASTLDDAAPTVVVDADYLERADDSDPVTATFETELTPADPAYVIFTSGSTGKPKGVTVTHGNVVALIDATTELFDVDENDVWTLFHSYAFDFSVWELWGPLSTGAHLVVPDHATTRSPADFATLIGERGVTVLNQTPSAFFALDAADLADTEDRETAGAGSALESLRYVIFGGEALDLPRLRSFVRRHPRTTLVNMYGITEVTVHATYLVLDKQIIDAATGSDVGALLPGFTGHLLDGYLRRVPVGAVGELYLAGPQVAAGYLQRPALHATRFVADPSGTGQVLYRTGDLFRQTRQGALIYFGRADTQVKIRGFRIELGEIRAALAALPGVRDAAVLTRPGPSDADRILAYAVGDNVTPESLHAALRDALPEHEVPSAVLIVDSIPLTVNGKTDAAALPEPEVGTAEGRTPTTEIESALADIFADTLGLPDPPRVDDDFFALGGDSIVSTTLVNRARRRGIRFTPRDVFTHRTVAGLGSVAEWIDDTTPAAPSNRDDASATGPTPIPLLPIVQRLREIGGAIDRFNQSLVVDTPAELDADTLRAMVRALLDSHEALRSSLQTVAGVLWTMQSAPPGSVDVDDVLRTVTVDRSVFGAPDALAAAVSAESAAAAGRLSPATGLMVAATWLTTDSPDDPIAGRLILVIHHLAVDGVSRRILLEDLRTLWETATTGAELQPIPTPTPLHAFAAAVTERAADPALLDEAAHWAQVLAPGGELVPGRLPTSGTVADQRRHVATLSPETSASLVSDLPGRRGVGITSLLLGALRVAATRALDTGDLIVDTERHGRDAHEFGIDADLSHTVGWFTTVAPIRLSATDDIGDAIADAENAWTAMPSAGAGFGMLRYLNPQLSGALATMSRPSVLLNYLGRFTVGGGSPWQPSAESTALAADPDPGLGVAYPLEIDIVCRDESSGPVVAATFSYLPDHLDDAAVRALADALCAALDSLAAPAESGVDQ